MLQCVAVCCSVLLYCEVRGCLGVGVSVSVVVYLSVCLSTSIAVRASVL